MTELWYLDSAYWRAHLLDEVLRHWLENAVDRRYGGYVTDFDRAWQPKGAGDKTLVSQARLVYNFACGYRHTGQFEYREAAEVGLAFLREHFLDRRDGGWFWQCRREGDVTDTRKDTYGHAFVIFALAEYARAFAVSEAVELAAGALAVLRDRMTDRQGGGLWTRATRDWQPETDRRSQNPHMHLLEGLMALYDVTTDGGVIDYAASVCELARDRFVHPEHGCLEEFFATDWSKPDDCRAEPIQVGHQFEWAWLLSRMADRAPHDGYRELAGDLMAWGIRNGFDGLHGGVFDQCDRQGRPVRDTKTFWPQSEALRALMYDYCGGRSHEDVLSSCAEFVRRHSVDREHGGWFTSVDRQGQPVNTDKGAAWKLDYHAVSLCDEALRLLTPGG
jgi:mannobiose 2-epimerase